MNEEAPEARKATTSAISSGSAMRRRAYLEYPETSEPRAILGRIYP
jgi:hypothetical protein